MLNILKKKVTNNALLLHIKYKYLYTYYKKNKIGLISNTSLTPVERKFYLQLRSTLQEKDLVVYDIGAAKGIISSCLEKLSNVSLIEAFEAIPEVYSSVKDKFKFSSKVSCHNVDLGIAPGLVQAGVSLLTIKFRTSL